MNSLINPPHSMTSREIAELTGKEHRNVLRDIDKLLKTLRSDLSAGFETATYIDGNGKSHRMFILDRDASYCLVAGYDVNARMRIIKRWQELEAALPPPITLPTHLETARMLVGALEREAALQAKIEADRPKVDFHDEITRAEGELLLREAAKILFGGQTGAERRMAQWMLAHNWLTKTGGFREPTAWAIQRGYMAQRLDLVHGTAYRVALLRPKGFAYLRHLLRTGELFTGSIAPEHLITAQNPDHNT